MTKRLSFSYILSFLLLCVAMPSMAQQFTLSDKGYFNCEGVDVMAFDDIYPEGHQGGISVIMNGRRIVTSGDIRLEATPGQWQPLPKQLKRETAGNVIKTTMQYPDSSRHMTGFNPMIYPDLHFTYSVSLESIGDAMQVTVDLDKPIPAEYAGKVGFNLEIFPGYAFGQPWIMDDQSGVYPRQPNSPMEFRKSNHEISKWDYTNPNRPVADRDHLIGEGYSPIVADDIIAMPYAEGHKFTTFPDDDYSRITIESQTGTMKLYDGRMNHNNGWFVLRTEIQPGVTKGAVKWILRPSIVKGWRHKAVVQTSQVGYHPKQQKVAVIELDVKDTPGATARLMRIDADGEHLVKTLSTSQWGNFLRYKYLKADFSDVSETGLYRVDYGESRSPLFRIASDVYDRGVWQPVIEYFLPVQMCHMRVSEKYRVWHDACHMDDALMAPAHNHIDGYNQNASDYGRYKAGEKVPGVNIGGWHDAGDYDLRIESQAGESYILTLAYELFHPEIDVTSIDQTKHITEIHQPDGKNDILQQVENGALTVVASHKALGRLYRGIICNQLRQYVLLGDAASMTDGIAGNDDDRWIYTENNPMREIQTAGQLAAIARVMRGYNDGLASECLDIAHDVFKHNKDNGMKTENVMARRYGIGMLLQAAVELYLTTGEKEYEDFLLDNQQTLIDNIERTAWFAARVEQRFAAMKGNKKAQGFSKAFRESLARYNKSIAEQAGETPYGVPYRPAIWGAGWDIQSFAFRHYFLASAYPDIVDAAPVMNALNFVLGCHPGSNQASFASGVGTQSATTAYGVNRADWSYIPGGVVSGTALIRPDFPELLEFPFLWQQTEYCLGGASSHYMFITLAAKELLKGKH